MRVAVIPARGGSKRIPRKNIKSFYGKPMIAWSIQAALDCECFDSVLVSTDDEEIADVAREWGASVPFLRPPELSDDHATTGAVIRHAVEWSERNMQTPVELACCIYATAPFLRPEFLRQGEAIMLEGNCSFAFAVTSFEYPIQRAVRILPDGHVTMFQPETFHVRSQDLEEAYHDAGQFYWGTGKSWKQEQVIFASHSRPVIIPRYLVQDVDTMDDWVRAEAMFAALELQTC